MTKNVEVDLQLAESSARRNAAADASELSDDVEAQIAVAIRAAVKRLEDCGLIATNSEECVDDAQTPSNVQIRMPPLHALVSLTRWLSRPAYEALVEPCWRTSTRSTFERSPKAKKVWRSGSSGADIGSS